MQKKLLFTVTTDLNHDQRMIRICTSLAAAGYDVTLVGRNLPSSQVLNNQPFLQKRLSCFFHKGKFFYLEYNLRLLFFLLFKKFDVITAIDLDTILPCFLIGKLKHKPIVYDAHEYFTEVPEVFNRPATKRIWEAVADFCIPRIKHCYTVGDGLANIFSERYGVPFEVIRNISVEKKAVEVKEALPNRKIILYQGALNEGRCIEHYIEAMRYIENAELHLAGDGDLKYFLKKIVEKNQLENKVKFLGKLSPDALNKTTEGAYIGLNLLENKGLSYYYSLANKTFDYIQASVPALHPDFPEYQAIVKNYEIGVLVSSNTIQDIAKNINLLLHDTEFYNHLKMECDRAKEKYIWKNEEKKLIIFYQKIS